MMERFPRYGFEHFFQLSFKDGGLTEGQFHALYEQAIDRKAEENKFIAKLHGFEIKSGPAGAGAGANDHRDAAYHEEINEFNYNGDPASVAHLTPEQREILTQKLMGQMKKDAKNLEMPKPGMGNR